MVNDELSKALESIHNDIAEAVANDCLQSLEETGITPDEDFQKALKDFLHVRIGGYLVTDPSMV